MIKKPVDFIPVGSKLTFVRTVGMRRSEIGQSTRYGEYLCFCGGKVIAAVNNVKRGLTRSCGCVVKVSDFGYVPTNSLLTYVKSVGRGLALYECKCGKEKIARASSVRLGNIRSCGCLAAQVRHRKRTEAQKEAVKKAATTHGLSKHRLYKIWADMIKRCENEKCKPYKFYGGRGVRVCDEWRNDFILFYNWSMSNGWQRGLQLDKDKILKNRGEVSLLYSPETCSYISRKENMNSIRSNKIFIINGVTKTMTEWAEYVNMNPKLLFGRIKSGWPIEKALTTNSNYYNGYKYNNTPL